MYIPGDLKIVVISILSPPLLLSSPPHVYVCVCVYTRAFASGERRARRKINYAAYVKYRRNYVRLPNLVGLSMVALSNVPRMAVSISAAILSRAPSAFHRACVFLLRDSALTRSPERAPGDRARDDPFPPRRAGSDCETVIDNAFAIDSPWRIGDDGGNADKNAAEKGLAMMMGERKSR